MEIRKHQLLFYSFCLVFGILHACNVVKECESFFSFVDYEQTLIKMKLEEMCSEACYAILPASNLPSTIVEKKGEKARKNFEKRFLYYFDVMKSLFLNP